jgi:hypothetical protein
MIPPHQQLEKQKCKGSNAEWWSSQVAIVRPLVETPVPQKSIKIKETMSI